jgi:hypothetical protein
MERKGQRRSGQPIALAVHEIMKIRRLAFLAEGVGFEPTAGVDPRRFSRPLP